MILVEIYSPAVDQTFDFELDEDADIGSVLIEVTGMIAKKTGSEKPVDASAFILYCKGREQPLPEGRTLYECGIRDGYTLVVV